MGKENHEKLVRLLEGLNQILIGKEKQITVDGVTYPLQEPFFVIATQNPIDFLGTYRLPEAQLDRFFCKISLGYPERQSEALMVKKMVKKLVWEEIPNVLESKDLVAMQKELF